MSKRRGELTRYMPHSHSDDLGHPIREGERAICGCGRVLYGVVHATWQTSWWRPVLWPLSVYWRRRLASQETDPQ